MSRRLRFSGPRVLPAPEVWKPAAAGYVLAVLDGREPESVPGWMPAILASMVYAALVTGCEADGLEEQAARDAARRCLAGISEGVS